MSNKNINQGIGKIKNRRSSGKISSASVDYLDPLRNSSGQSSDFFNKLNKGSTAKFLKEIENKPILNLT